MSGLEALAAAAAASGALPVRDAVPAAAAAPAAAPGVTFADMLISGLRQVDAKISSANALVKQFAVDDTVPVHQVTIALEEARLAVELAVQIRARLVEGYREIMNMQL
jgi:flagellar hook-basal body complex protein FliE